MYLPCTWVRNLSQVGAQTAANRGAEAGRRAPGDGFVFSWSAGPFRSSHHVGDYHLVRPYPG
jgi:hypothetical protein